MGAHPEVEDRVLGCLLGGAIGDALGGPYENRRPPFSVAIDHEWRLSDDTQLTLATCEAIVAGRKVDPAGIAASLAEGHRRRRFSGLGASTLKALTELVAGGHWALVGRKGEQAAGNGAAMRVAPLAFFCDPADETARTTIRDVCRITHHNDEAYVGALAVVVAVRAAWLGAWPREGALLERVVAALPDTRVRDRLVELAGLRDVSLADLGGRFGASGHVVASVPLALAAAERVASGFETVLLDVVSCGGDADTIAAIAGQVMGTSLGSSRLPAAWTARLPDQRGLREAARRLAGVVPPRPAG